MALTNPKILEHAFLDDMFDDDYFPKSEVEKVKAVLLRVCERIEAEKPASLSELYAITHEATEDINDLAEDFHAADSEIETVARESISADMIFIAQAYGFTDADREALVAPRDW